MEERKRNRKKKKEEYKPSVKAAIFQLFRYVLPKLTYIAITIYLNIKIAKLFNSNLWPVAVIIITSILFLHYNVNRLMKYSKILRWIHSSEISSIIIHCCIFMSVVMQLVVWSVVCSGHFSSTKVLNQYSNFYTLILLLTPFYYINNFDYYMGYDDKPKKAKYFNNGIVGVLLICYMLFSFFIAANYCYCDKNNKHEEVVQIVDKYISHGRSRSYIIETLLEDGTPIDFGCNKEKYNTSDIGDSLKFIIVEGYFGLPVIFQASEDIKKY